MKKTSKASCFSMEGEYHFLVNTVVAANKGFNNANLEDLYVYTIDTTTDKLGVPTSNF